MLQQGDKAPAFSLESDAGKKVSLQDFRGKRVVLYFYPRDNTPGCTREAQGFAALMPSFTKAGAVVLGVSKDTVKSHCSFRDKYSLTFPLLSDPSLSAHNAFGAYGKKMMYGRPVEGTIRSTFVIDGNGVIERVFPSVKVDGHPDAILAHLTGGAPAQKSAVKPAAKVAPKKAAAKAPVAKKAPLAKKLVKKAAVKAVTKAPAAKKRAR